MQIGMIGLGKMGYQLTLNLLDNGFEVVANDVDPASVKKFPLKAQSQQNQLRY